MYYTSNTKLYISMQTFFRRVQHTFSSEMFMINIDETS